MKIKQINTIYFSPTGTGKTIVKKLAEQFGVEKTGTIDLTYPDYSDSSLSIEPGSISIIAMPVYSGRLPLNAVERFSALDGKQSLAIVVVVYGNREFDDALLELKELAEKVNFRMLAAAAFIGEHSYSTNQKPIAANRPDEQDFIQVEDFARQIREKLSATAPAALDIPSIPGKFPFVERKQRPLFSPDTNIDNCTLCGSCVESCPTGAISISDQIRTSAEVCIWCCACIKVCPEEARSFDNEVVRGIRERLFNNCQIRKEPEFFL